MNTIPLKSEAANELYASLPPELRTELANYERSVAVPAGTNLIKRGVLPDQLVIVNSGKVEITLDCVRESILLDCATAGKVFGMRAVVSGELPEEDVTCHENCTVTLIPRDTFLKTVRQHPEILSWLPPLSKLTKRFCCCRDGDHTRRTKARSGGDEVND